MKTIHQLITESHKLLSSAKQSLRTDDDSPYCICVHDHYREPRVSVWNDDSDVMFKLTENEVTQ